MTLKKSAWIVLPAAAFCLVSGCTKLKYDRWRTLTLQSGKAEVEAVLGDEHVAWKKPDRWMYHDGDRQISVNLEFADGERLSYSRWVDPDHGMAEIGTAAIDGSDLIERDTGKRQFDVR